MSIVLNVICPYGSILAADTRMSREDNGNFLIVSETTRKIFSLTPYSALGFTGNYDFALEIKAFAEEQAISDLLFTDRIAVALREKALSIREKYAKRSVPDVQFIVAGINSSGQLCSYTVHGAKDFELCAHFIAPGACMSFVNLCDTPADRLEQQLSQIDPSSFSIEGILRIMDDHINYVADRNRTVNKNIEFIIVPPRLY